MRKYSVVMIRHGESEWNQKNLFCGWFDSDLSDAGRAEVEAAGKGVLERYATTPLPHLGLHNLCNIKYHDRFYTRSPKSGGG